MSRDFVDVIGRGKLRVTRNYRVGRIDRSKCVMPGLSIDDQGMMVKMVPGESGARVYPTHRHPFVVVLQLKVVVEQQAIYVQEVVWLVALHCLGRND